MLYSRIRRYKDYNVTDFVKIRVCDLAEHDYFEHMGTIYKVKKIERCKITYMGIKEYSIRHHFGAKSKQFVNKVLLEYN